MNGFLVFITMVVSLASWGGYSFPLPGIHQVGEWITIESDSACPYRVISADVEMSDNRVDYWTNRIKFDEPGKVDKLYISCAMPSFIDPQFDEVPVDWMVR